MSVVEEETIIEADIVPKATNGYESLDEDYSSDEEFEKNRVGDIPLEWYDDYDHVGRDITGQTIIKVDGLGGDNIDKLLKSRDDPLFRRTIFDYKNQESIVLTNRELNLVKRMVKGKFVSETSTFDPHPDYIPYYSSKILDMPIHYARPLSKKSFLPNISEKRKILEIIRGIRSGKIKMKDDKKDDIKSNFADYLLWNKTPTEEEEEESLQNLSDRRKRRHIPAPKLELPGHSVSYHPPKEYLFDEEEEKKYLELSEEDKISLIKPQDYNKLRYVPAYNNIVKEQFERCLDLYLCTRIKKDRLKIDPQTLVPKLPSPKELRPFPNILALSYFGHIGQVRSISISKCGSILISGDSNGFLKIWEVETTRCLTTINIGKILKITNPEITKVAINPKFSLVAISIAPFILLLDISEFINPGDHLAKKALNEILNNKDITNNNDNNVKLVNWLHFIDKSSKIEMLKIEILDENVTEIKNIVWHPKGLYLSSVNDTIAKKKKGQLHIHHIIKKQSQKLISPNHSASSLDIQTICFHPTKSILFIATKQNIFSYDLIKRKTLKRIKSGSKWVSSIDIDSSGDHLVIGGYDKQVNWIDLDLKDEPFKTMKFHSKAVRSVKLHSSYPLLASASDDGTLHIFHAKVYDDLMRNAMIVPVKKLKAHFIVAETGVFQIAFHPTQPWVFTCGGDKNIHLFQNIP